MAGSERWLAAGPLACQRPGVDHQVIRFERKEKVAMTRIDIHSAALMARQRDAELRRKVDLKRLVEEARSLAPRAEAVPVVPVMSAWLRLCAGPGASGA
jgi:hypothetical protein